MRFEYKIVGFSTPYDASQCVKVLDTYGEEGWELVTVDLTSPTHTYFFKRRFDWRTT